MTAVAADRRTGAIAARGSRDTSTLKPRARLNRLDLMARFWLIVDQMRDRSGYGFLESADTACCWQSAGKRR